MTDWDHDLGRQVGGIAQNVLASCSPTVLAVTVAVAVKAEHDPDCDCGNCDDRMFWCLGSSLREDETTSAEVMETFLDYTTMVAGLADDGKPYMSNDPRMGSDGWEMRGGS